jgi:hypothetical protein
MELWESHLGFLYTMHGNSYSSLLIGFLHSHQYTIKDQETAETGSIGITIYRIRKADQAMLTYLKLSSNSTYSFLSRLHSINLPYAGNTKGGSITVPLTSCLTGLESAV